MGDAEHNVKGTRRTHSTPVALLTVILAAVGLVLAWGLAGWTWGLIFPVLLPAAVPLWTQQREVRRAAALAAKKTADGAGLALDIANAEHDPDPTPTHGVLVRVAVSIVLLVAALGFAVVQVRTKQEAGWWLVAACVPLFGFFWYAARQWCRRTSESRVVAYGLAAWTVGLSGNFAASAITSDTCAEHAERKLAAVLGPIGDGVAYIVNWTKAKDVNDAALAAKVAEMDRKLDEIARGQMTAKGDDGASSVVTLTADEIVALEEIGATGNHLQQARAIVLLAAERRSVSLWAEADDAIMRLESDRDRGKWKDDANEERYLLLKGDRKFHADDPDGAIEWYEKAASSFPRSATAWAWLGRALSDARKGDTKALWDAARRAYLSGLKVVEPNSTLMATLLNNLATIQTALGDLPRAQVSIMLAMAIESKHFAPDHPNFAIGYSNLAVIQRRQGDLPGARDSMEKAIDIAEKYWGADHRTLGRMRSNFATIQLAQGDSRGARASMEKAIVIQSKHFAPDHPDFATSYNNLSAILIDLGEFDEAVRYMRMSMEIAVKHWGKDHPMMGASYSNLAMMQKDQRDFPGARASIETAIAIAEKHLGADHPDLATMRSNLATIQLEQGDLPGARVSTERAIAIDSKHFDPDHTNFATSYSNLANIAVAQGMIPEAVTHWRKSYAIYLKALGPDHRSTKADAAMLRKYDPPGP